jgi:aspartyl-tRNA(Asn)/glutamyl-tRNA(Gln) amidotransferase subunit C
MSREVLRLAGPAVQLLAHLFACGSSSETNLNAIIRLMALTLEQVEHIAALARLRLTDDEKARYRGQLSAVLDYMAKLRQLDTSAIEPTATVLPLRTVLRPDEVAPSLTPEALLANAPAAEAQMFRVPPVLE